MKKLDVLDKLGALGALLSAAACPACFPLLAVVGTALGLGIFASLESSIVYALQGFVVLALIGNIVSYRAHRKVAPLVLGILASLLVFFALYVWFSPFLIYVGLSGLSIAAILNVVAKRSCARCDPHGSIEPILKSVITCPQCGLRKEEIMPTNACLHFYECSFCKTLLKPQPGDCCVFCSYGTVQCPPIQKGAQCQTC